HRLMRRVAFPGFSKSSIVKQLRETAKTDSIATDDLAEAERLQKIHEAVYGRDGKDYYAKNMHRRVEYVIHLIDGLTDAGRRLISPALRDKVVATLGTDPGNTWRIRRFNEACENNRTPYTAQIGDITAPAVSADTLRDASNAKDQVFEEPG